MWKKIEKFSDVHDKLERKTVDIQVTRISSWISTQRNTTLKIDAT